MTTSNCVNTESEAHDSANATFEEAASQLEEQGYSHEINSDGVACFLGTRMMQPPSCCLLLRVVGGHLCGAGWGPSERHAALHYTVLRHEMPKEVR
jgi:hypothetical protein